MAVAFSVFSFRSTFPAALVVAGLAVGAPAAALDRHVNPASPAARDSGAGPASAPYKTIAYAMVQLQPGDHLYIHAGTYRETLRFPTRTWSAASQTIVEGVGQVTIKGSDVFTGWSSLGNGKYMRSLPAETAQVFVNGQALQQIGGRLFNAVAGSYEWPGRVAGDQNSMPVNSFYYDAGTRSLFIRTALASLTGQNVEVSTRQYSLFGSGLANVTVKNLAFEHGNASPTTRSGLFTVIGNRLTVQNITMNRADAVGIEMNGDDNKLLDSVANNCGQVGIKARGSRNQLLRNVTNYNNTRGFNKYWEAGGAKFTGAGGLRNSVVSQHTAIGNKGDGIWFDWTNLNNQLTNSLAADNSGFGVHYEASFGGVITNNYMIRNGQRGIHLPHSSNSVVAFNLVAGNGLQGIVVVDEGVRDKTGAYDLTPVGNKVFGNLVAFNQGALVLPAALSTNKSDGNVYAGSVSQNLFRQGWQGSTIDLARWQATAGQDKSSRVYSLQMSSALAGTTSAAYITWGNNFRASVPKVTVSSDWLALVPGAKRDGYPGPQ